MLREKLEALERMNKVLKEKLVKSENECSAALARAIAAEKIQQTLQGELSAFQKSRGNELPLGRLEQLHVRNLHFLWSFMFCSCCLRSFRSNICKTIPLFSIVVVFSLL